MGLTVYVDAMATLGDVLRARRVALGMKQRDLARAAEITPGYVGQLESERDIIPSPDVIERVARALQIPQAILLQAVGYLTDVEDRVNATLFPEYPTDADLADDVVRRFNGDRAAARRALVKSLDKLLDQ